MRKLILALLLCVPCVAWGETFGYTNEGAATRIINAGALRGRLAVCPQPGTLQSISAYLRIEYDKVKTRAAIYSSDGELLGVSAEVLANTGDAWITYSISGVPLLAESYYLVVWGNLPVGEGQSYMLIGEGTGYNGSGGTYNSTTSPASTVSFSSNGDAYGVYATYTTGGGGAKTPLAPPQVHIFQ